MASEQPDQITIPIPILKCMDEETRINVIHLFKELFNVEVELLSRLDCQHPNDKLKCNTCKKMIDRCTCDECTVTCLECGDIVLDEQGKQTNSAFFNSIDAVLSYKEKREIDRERLFHELDSTLDFYVG